MKLQLVGAVAVLAQAACQVADVDLANHPCPCVAGWTCDVARNTCVRAGATACLACAEGSACDPVSGQCVHGKVTPTNLTAQWTTPYSIHWTWDPIDPQEQAEFSAFELVVGPTETDVKTRSPAASVWTSAQNPELGSAIIQHSGLNDPVVRTITDGLSPSTTYWGQLVVVDTHGVRSATAPASGTTISCPVGDIPIVEDSVGSAFPIPCNIAVGCGQPALSLSYAADSSRTCTFDTTNGAKDTCTFEFDTTCTPGVGGTCSDCSDPQYCQGMDCGENLRLYGLNVPFTALTLQAFASAYLELALASDEQPYSGWSEVGLILTEALSNPCETCWNYAPWTVRGDGQYRVLQIPLRSLTRSSDGAFLTFDEVGPASGSTVFQLRVYGAWPARVRVGAVSIKW